MRQGVAAVGRLEAPADGKTAERQSETLCKKLKVLYHVRNDVSGTNIES